MTLTECRLDWSDICLYYYPILRTSLKIENCSGAYRKTALWLLREPRGSRKGVMPSFRLLVCLTCAFAALGANSVAAQEGAYFVTYNHYLEEQGSLEVALATTTGLPRAGRPSYTAPWLELEYGLTGWWTTELYLEGVTTRTNGSGFTGWRWENRFRPLKGEHWVNPVLYVEYEGINEATRIQKEVVAAARCRPNRSRHCVRIRRMNSKASSFCRASPAPGICRRT